MPHAGKIDYWVLGSGFYDMVKKLYFKQRIKKCCRSVDLSPEKRSLASHLHARGNKSGVDAQFCPPHEKLAWTPEAHGEMDLPAIWPDPSPLVVQCLKTHQGWAKVEANLPDIALVQ